ncbi:MAG TPA: methyltransferase [Caulobacteraceae bacterium]|jgi:predicted methyltransferase
MKLSYFAAAAAAVVLAAGAVGAQQILPPWASGAVANPARPQADRDRDALRKPGEVLVFSGVKPGDKVLELIPGGGYFTRLLSGAVGPKGHVTEGLPNLTGTPDVAQKSNGVAADAHFGNVSEAHFSTADLAKLGPVDVVWTSQNYHDLHLTRFKLDVVAFDKAVYAALKPGGVFFIEDHAAKPGSGLEAPDKLHRIDEAVVKQEVESAGFKLAGESDILRNPADDHTLLVFNPAIRGHTDQFLLKFRKPK